MEKPLVENPALLKILKKRLLLLKIKVYFAVPLKGKSHKKGGSTKVIVVIQQKETTESIKCFIV